MISIPLFYFFIRSIIFLFSKQEILESWEIDMYYRIRYSISTSERCDSRLDYKVVPYTPKNSPITTKNASAPKKILALRLNHHPRQYILVVVNKFEFAAKYFTATLYFLVTIRNF